MTHPFIFSLSRVIPLAVCLVVAPSLRAAVVNVDFGLTPRTSGTAVSLPYSGSAAAPDSGTIWNSLNVSDSNVGAAPNATGTYRAWSTTTTSSNLQDSFGNATGITVSALGSSSTGVFGILQTAANFANVADNAENLMRDYLIALGGTTQFVELSGFTSGVIVDLYLYGAGDQSIRNTIFSITDINGSHTATTNGVPTGAHDLTLQADYVVISGIVPDIDGKIRIGYASPQNSGTDTEGLFNGLQAVIIPEPSTFAMLIGALSLGFVRRRTR